MRILQRKRVCTLRAFPVSAVAMATMLICFFSSELNWNFHAQAQQVSDSSLSKTSSASRIDSRSPVSSAYLSQFAKAPGGVLIAIGGGATTSGDRSVLKTSQLDIAKAAFAILDRQISGGSRIPGGLCMLSYRERDAAGLREEFEPTIRILRAAGVPPRRLFVLGSTSKEESNDAVLVQAVRDSCGLIYFPGGDQTAQAEAWFGTELSRAIQRLYSLGGVLMGKSAGAAIQGSWIFTPASDAITATEEYLKGRSLSASDLTLSDFVSEAAELPAFLIETHVGDRERSARGAVFLAELQERMRKDQLDQGGSRHPAILAVDSDTAAIIRIDPATNDLMLEVVGFRAVEILSVDEDTHIARSPSGDWPEITSGRSDLLLSGARARLSQRGKVLTIQHQRPERSVSEEPKRPRQSLAECVSGWVGDSILGSEFSVRRKRSRIWFDVPQKGRKTPLDIEDPEASYAYLTGSVRMLRNPRTGCGLWLSRAFDSRSGQAENRLNLTRYALASGEVDWAFSVHEESRVDILSSQRFAFLAAGSGEYDIGRSSFVLDLRQATHRQVADLVYQELGGGEPLQTGQWTGARFFLLPPGSQLHIAGSGAKDHD